MSKKLFSNEEIEMLSKNEYVKKVSKKGIKKRWLLFNTEIIFYIKGYYFLNCPWQGESL